MCVCGCDLCIHVCVSEGKCVCVGGMCVSVGKCVFELCVSVGNYVCVSVGNCMCMSCG